MAASLPPDLELRCIEILDPDVQGVPLTKRDYAWMFIATVVVPAILIVIGVAS